MSTDESRRHKRLSADLPQHWLDDPRFLRLPGEARLLYLSGLMWAIGRTDGKIPSYALTRLWPDDQPARAGAVTALVTAGMWRPYTADGGGWRYPDWATHQSTVAQIEYQRDRKRRNQADSRANRVSADVTGDIAGDIPGEYGTARQVLALKEAERNNNGRPKSRRNPDGHAGRTTPTTGRTTP